MIEALEKGGARGPSGLGADLREQKRLSPAVPGRRRREQVQMQVQVGQVCLSSVENQEAFQLVEATAGWVFRRVEKVGVASIRLEE